ncbi:hypothetical protein M9Y10_003933 [Tritrichomonas musculus]|uniref:DUF3447 domain-containing protein n=1 Tax=Tritrichomonas musculus TaxID=1915356 RepID=A0ABR2JQN2_9EUKA
MSADSPPHSKETKLKPCFIDLTPELFTFIVNGKEYKCNILGVNYSNVIRELREKDPNLDQYEYNFDNKNNEFQNICKIFNFQKVQITVKNVKSLLKISEDLQIEKLLNDLNEFNESFELLINESEVVDEIFTWLHKIDSLTVETVKNSILDSIWCHTEENIIELTAIILQVIRTSHKTHPFLLELLKLLQKSSSEENDLHLLMPFITKHLLHSFYKSPLYCSFIYQLTKIGQISIERIVNQIFIFDQFSSQKNPANNLDNLELSEIYYHRNAMIWFFPEILAVNPANINKILDGLNNKEFRFLQFYMNHIENFKKMRDTGEPEDQITLAILHDDVDTLQSIIASRNININNEKIPMSIFDLFDRNIEKSYINYAAECGAVKSFKYLLLNSAKLDILTLGFAVYGGNSEIIRIIEQDNTYFKNYVDDFDDDDYLHTNYYFNIECLLNPIISSIMTHSYDLFTWILEKKSKKINIKSLLSFSAQNGNINAIIQLNDKELISFNNLTNISSMLSMAADSGFYRFIQMLLNMNIREDVISKNIKSIESSFVDFGNLSIFKIFFNSKEIQADFNKLLEIAIQKEYLNIVQYIIEELYKPNEKKFILSMFENASSLSNSSIFEFLISQYGFDELKDKFNFDLFDFQSLLDSNCSSDNFENVKKFTDFILEKYPNTDFSIQLINASKFGRENIGQYFIDKKVLLDSTKILQNSQYLMYRTVKFIQNLIDSIDPQFKDVLSKTFLHKAFVNGNIDLINLLLNENTITHNSLLYAIHIGDIEIINKILQINCKPSFINQISVFGTALTIAAHENHIHIVKRLLEIDQIDVNNFEMKNGNTPLIIAVENKNYEMAKLFIDHPKTNINFKNIQFQTALTIAAANKDERIISLLINNEKFNANESEINFAFFISDEKIAKQLISVEGLDVNYCEEVNLYETTLIRAFNLKFYDKVKMIIEHPSYDPIKSRSNEQIMNTIKQVDANKNIDNVKFSVNPSLTEPGIICRLKQMEKNPFDRLFIASQSSADIYNLLNPNIADNFCLSYNYGSFIDIELKDQVSINGIQIIYIGEDFLSFFDFLADGNEIVPTKEEFFIKPNGLRIHFDSILCKKVTIRYKNIWHHLENDNVVLNSIELLSKNAKFSKGVFATLIENNEFHDPHKIPVLITSNNFDLATFFLLDPPHYVSTFIGGNPWFLVEFTQGSVILNGFRLKQTNPRMKGFKIVCNNDIKDPIPNWLTLIDISEKTVGEHQELDIYLFDKPSPPVKYVSFIQTEANWSYVIQLNFAHIDFFGSYL